MDHTLTFQQAPLAGWAISLSRVSPGGLAKLLAGWLAGWPAGRLDEKGERR